MAHNVTFRIPERKLGRADVEFDVSYDDGKLGRLKVSQGTVEWVPKDLTHGYELAWNDFGAFMEGHGKRKS